MKKGPIPFDLFKAETLRAMCRDLSAPSQVHKRDDMIAFLKKMVDSDLETAREEAVRELPKRASGSRPSTSGTKRKNDADEADVNNDGPRTRRGRASDPGPGPLKRRRIPSKRAEEAAKQAELKAASRTPRKRTKSSPSKTPTKRAARSTTRSPAKKTPARKLGGTIFDGVLMPAVTRRTPRGKETQAHDDDVDAEGDDEDPADQVGDAGNHVVLSSSSGNGSSDKENETVLPGAGGRSETDPPEEDDDEEV